MSPRDRLATFLSWRGWSKTDLANSLKVDPSTITKITAGQRHPGLAIALAIERVTAEARDDGETWPGESIRAGEWVAAHEQTLTAAAPLEECA